MTLTNDFWYRDQHRVRWDAPKGVGREAPPRAKAVGFESMLPIGAKNGAKGEVEYRELTEEERARLEKEITENGSPEEKEFLQLKEKIEREKLSLEAMVGF